MAAFCHFWRMNPADVRAMTLAEFRAFDDYRAEYLRGLKER